MEMVILAVTVKEFILGRLVVTMIKDPAPNMSSHTDALTARTLRERYGSGDTMRILILTVLACFSNFIWADTPDNYQQEIQEVEAHAVLLLEKIKSKDKYELETLKNYRELEDSLSDIVFPNYSYTAYTIEQGGEYLLYLVAANSISRSVIIGRHFVTKIDEGVADTLNIASSTNGCINLGEPKKDAAAGIV